MAASLSLAFEVAIIKFFGNLFVIAFFQDKSLSFTFFVGEFSGAWQEMRISKIRNKSNIRSARSIQLQQTT